MAFNPSTNIEAFVKCLNANGSKTAAGAAIATVAGATEDGVKVTGESIDRQGYDSIAIVVTGTATLAASETFSVALELQESSDNSSWDTAEVVYASTALVTDSGSGSNTEFQQENAINLRGRKRYIRFNVTPALSASSTDLAVWEAIAVLGGADNVPAA